VTRTRSRLVASIMALALVAASCGDDDDDAESTAETGGAATTAAAPATTAATTTGAPATTAEATTAAPATTEAAPATSAAPEAQTIKVGFAWPDLSAFLAVCECYSVGDPEEQMLAVLEAYHQDGTLPVNGVDVELVSESFDSLDTDSKLAVCQKFGGEDEVFAVLGGRIFTEGAECMGSRFQTPVIDTDQAPAATLESAAPYMFTLKPDETEIVSAFANWGIGRGSFEGKKIGLYWEGGHDAAADAFKQILTDNGLSIASEIQTGGSGSVGNEQDALAAQKFQADGVDMVVFFVGSSGIVNFLQAAADQNYTPGYLDLDWASHMNDVAAGAYNQDQWTGVEALSTTRLGELPELSADAETCIANYEQFSGKTIDRNPPEKSGEFSNILIACELGNILIEGLRGATADGGELTKDSFIAAVEGIQDLPGQGWINTISFGADDHTAPADVREVTWDAACPCWTASSDWMPISDFE
jgi:ABC-type branched-subunit amino acid transport system substrate-binding protein